MTTINAAALVTLTEQRPKTPPPLVTTPIGKSWEGAPNTNREARRLVNEVRSWAQQFDAEDAKALVQAMDGMERLLVRVWTEVDESLLCLSLAESSNHPERAAELRTTAIGYLKRWLNG